LEPIGDRLLLVEHMIAERPERKLRSVDRSFLRGEIDAARLRKQRGKLPAMLARP